METYELRSRAGLITSELGQAIFALPFVLVGSFMTLGVWAQELPKLLAGTFGSVFMLLFASGLGVCFVVLPLKRSAESIRRATGDPYQVVIPHSGLVRFVGSLRRQELRAGHIRGIVSYLDDVGHLVALQVVHVDGVVRVHGKNLDRLAERLAELNRNAEVVTRDPRAPADARVIRAISDETVNASVAEPHAEGEEIWSVFRFSSRSSAIVSAVIPAVVGLAFTIAGLSPLARSLFDLISSGLAFRPDVAMTAFGALGIAILIGIWRRLTSQVYEFLVGPTGSIVLRLPFADRMVEASDIRKLRTYVAPIHQEDTDPRRLRIHLDRGSVTVSYTPVIEGLMERLMALNPRIECQREHW